MSTITQREQLEARDAELGAEQRRLEEAKAKIGAGGAAEALAQAQAVFAEKQGAAKRSLVEMALDMLPKSAFAKDRAAVRDAQLALDVAREDAELLAMGVREIEALLVPIYSEREQIRLALIELQGAAAREWAQTAAREYRTAAIALAHTYARLHVVAAWRHRVEGTGAWQPKYTGARHAFGFTDTPWFDLPGVPGLDAFADCGPRLLIGLDAKGGHEMVDLDPILAEVRAELAPLGITI